jgi:ribonuclease P protein component
MNYGLTKSERLTSQLVIDKLFAGGNASMAAFPLRIVYMQMEKEEQSGDAEHDESLKHPPVSILVSVPKKRFRHAVDRNRMKRLIREAYRLNKHILWNALEGKDFRLALAFVCITDTLPTFRTVNKSVTKALTRVAERVEG